MDRQTIKKCASCLFILAFCLLHFASCKTNQWHDWKELNEALLAANVANNPDVTVTPSGLQYRILADPNKTEACPHSGCTILCDYETKLLNGALVDSASNATFAVAQLISGVQEGVHLIHVHGDIELWIPYQLAYGSEGAGSEGYRSFVPPYSAIYFKVHIDASTAD